MPTPVFSAEVAEVPSLPSFLVPPLFSVPPSLVFAPKSSTEKNQVSCRVLNSYLQEFLKFKIKAVRKRLSHVA